MINTFFRKILLEGNRETLNNFIFFLDLNSLGKYHYVKCEGSGL